MRNLDMRPTRLIYVENDSALRRILGEMLNQSKELEILGSYANSDDALNRTLVRKADVALIDFSLDQNWLGVASIDNLKSKYYCNLKIFNNRIIEGENNNSLLLAHF